MDTIDFGEFEYQFETQIEDVSENNVYVLIIYDISENKNRNKLASFLQGYGFRVQKSCFEAYLSEVKFKELKRDIGKYIKGSDEDSIRIYKIIGKGQVTCYGKQVGVRREDVIII